MVRAVERHFEEVDDYQGNNGNGITAIGVPSHHVVE
jgi:hypothetical protein